MYGCDSVPPDLTASNLCQDNPLLAKAAGPVAKKTCRACAVPNRYFVHCHELLPKFLSQIDISSDVLRESDLLQETVSDVSEYMLHEANNPIDSGYHSPHQWSQPTEMHLATQYPFFQLLLIKFLVLSQKVEP